MEDEDKSREELLRKLEELRVRLAQLEGAEARRIQAERGLRGLAHLDELSGLYNRNAFLILALQQLRIARRARRPMLLLYCRAVNVDGLVEAIGPQEADRALAEVGRIVKSTFRESDIVARISAADFAVLAVEAAERRGLVLANRLRKALSDQKAKGAVPHQLCMRTALARWDPENPCTVKELLERAAAQIVCQTREQREQQEEGEQ